MCSLKKQYSIMNKKFTRSKAKKEKPTVTMSASIDHQAADGTSRQLYKFDPQMFCLSDFLDKRPHFHNHRVFDEDDDDLDQPPLTRKLKHLLKSVSPRHKYYVYDIHYYETEKKKNPKLPKMTEDTLRIGVIAPMILGSAQQNESILQWAVQKDLLPPNWEGPVMSGCEISHVMRTTAEIADTFVQCLLRTEASNLVKISYHMGEWYSFSNRRARHEMREDYKLDRLKRDLQEIYLLQSIWYIYTEVPKEVVWHIAVFVCHQYFFYLADSEYKKHTLLRRIELSQIDTTAMRLKDEGNECHKAEKYVEAIDKYTDAIKISPYNHMLYSNRAISYLKLKDSTYRDLPSHRLRCALSAMSDAFRSVKLDPLYAKGHDRYAMALYALDQQEQARKALEAAIKILESNQIDHSEIKSLERRLAQYTPKAQVAKKKADGASSKAKSTSKETKAASNAIRKTRSNSLAHGNIDTLKDYTNLQSSAENSDSSSTGSKSSLSSDKTESKTDQSTSILDKQEKQLKSSSRSDKAKPKKNHKSLTTIAKERNITPTGKSRGSAEKGDKVNEQGKMEGAADFAKLPTEKTAEDLAVAELDRTIRSGSEALLQKKYRFAINLYDKCFGLIHESNVMKVRMTADRTLLLRYARSVAYIYAGPNEDILLGIKELTHILELQPSQTMKAITLYEMGTAYTKQHRYEEAIGPVKEALTLCDSKKGLRDVYSWPGTDVFIEHTDKTVLKDKLTSLLNECKNPPQPDFNCLSTLCTNYGHFSRFIYVDDPDFRGYVCIICTEKCHLYYHRDCWKRKHLKVNAGCVTPDCDGTILRCSEYDEQLQKVCEDKSDTKYSKPLKEKKKVLKLRPSSLVRIEGIENRKKERKARRAERNRSVADAEDGTDLADKILAAAENPESPAADLRNSNFIVKHNKRDELEVERQSTRRANRRVKSKQVMSLEEFCGPPLFEDVSSNPSSGSIPMPPQLREDVAKFDQDYHMEKLPVVIQGVAVEKLKETVLEFYYDMLESGGPKKADSTELLGFLEYEKAAKELVDHCHGLTRFLLSSNMFQLVENFICVNRESDIKKAHEMVEALRNAPYGVGVVQSNFKEQLDEVSGFKPERKLYSGYEDTPGRAHNYDSYNTQEHWQSVVQGWNEATRADDASVGSRERSGSTSTGISEGEPEQPSVFEPPPPSLREEWKKYQDQKIRKSLTTFAESEAYIEAAFAEPEEVSVAEEETSYPNASVEIVDQRTFFTNPPLNTFATPHQPAALPAHSRDQMAFPNSSTSADSLSSEQNTNSDIDFPSGLSSNSNSKMFGVTYLPVSQSLSPPSFSDSLHIADGLYSSYNPLPLLPRKNVAPIGSSYSHDNNTFGLSPGHFSSTPSWSGAATASSQGSGCSKEIGVSFGTQTEKPSSGDKSCNTEYDIMDSYDKKVMECQGLQQRNENLADELTRLKQASSVNISDLKDRLNDAIEAEKAAKIKSDKIQQQSEKESRKWKEERKALTEELATAKQLAEEKRRKYESSESKVKELKDKLEMQTQQQDKELEKRAAMTEQHQAALDFAEQRLIDAQVEVVNERQRYALYQLEELLSTTNRSIEQQKLQVQRMMQGGGTLPNIVVKNAEFSNQRREKLMAVKREQESLYESQREAIRCGSIPLSNIPKLSPPSLMEIITSTSLPIPQPAMIPVGHQPGMLPMNPQLIPRMRSQLMPIPGVEKRLVQAHGEAEQSRASPEPNQGLQVTANTPETVVSKQVNRKNVENQLIQDIQNVFPHLSSDDVRAYIAKLRETRQGLTGLKLAELKRHVIELVLQSSSQLRN
ncbi:E3 ubiquitin-protein ligase TTC3-like isoform X2 [Watersipora subatra]|uniref:E3 ubiquitin-protein ligase TTC3-like isoform X2 n=1 Tax=Watersipora subatra TaxID=2589382 RepID=UPI00355BF2DD